MAQEGLSESADERRSRGLLVSDYLTGDMNPAEYADLAQRDAGLYGGFNLLVGDRSELHYASSHDGQRKVGAGVHGLSNGKLDGDWPKVKRLSGRLRRMVQEGDIDPEPILDLMRDRDPALESQLPDTGVGQELELFLSPIFIQSQSYGTRCSTLILMRKDGKVIFYERSFNEYGTDVGTYREDFHIDPAA